MKYEILVGINGEMLINDIKADSAIQAEMAAIKMANDFGDLLDPTIRDASAWMEADGTYTAKVEVSGTYQFQFHSTSQELGVDTFTYLVEEASFEPLLEWDWWFEEINEEIL